MKFSREKVSIAGLYYRTGADQTDYSICYLILKQKTMNKHPSCDHDNCHSWFSRTHRIGNIGTRGFTM